MSDTVSGGKRQEVLAAAGKLFLANGVDGTSVQQIADRVGCTKAALYYHFPKGKGEIFATYAATQLPDVTGLIGRCGSMDSLSGFLGCAASTMSAGAADGAAQARWLVSEYPKLDDRQQAAVRQAFLHCIDEIAAAVGRFVTDQREARRFAATLFCATFGYTQLFVGMELAAESGLSFEEFVGDIARMTGADTGA